MPLVAAQCTNCGGTLQVDDAHDAAVCKFCNTPFIVEKAVQNYQIHNSYNIENANIIMNDDKSFEKRLASAEEYLYYLKDYASAYKIYDEIEDIAPGNYKVWYGKICSRTMDFNAKVAVEMLVNGSIFYKDIERYIDSAYMTVPNEERNAFHIKVTTFLNECKKELQIKVMNINKKMQDVNVESNQCMNSINQLKRDIQRIDKKNTGMNGKYGRNLILEKKRVSFKPILIIICILITLSQYMYLYSSLDPLGYVLYGLLGFSPMLIYFIVGIVLRSSRRSNEKKVMQERSVQNQKRYEISSYDNKLRENQNYMNELESDMNSCNRYMAVMDSILEKHIV